MSTLKIFLLVSLFTIVILLQRGEKTEFKTEESKGTVGVQTAPEGPPASEAMGGTKAWPGFTFAMDTSPGASTQPDYNPS